MKTEKKNEKTYSHIWAWGRLLGSFAYYVKGEEIKARKDDAPADAIYYSAEDEKWVRFQDCDEATRTRVQTELARAASLGI